MPYDYTRDDQSGHIPESAEDYVIGDVSAPSKSAAQIQEENTFPPVPPGDHLLVVQGFAGPPKPNYFKVFVDGILDGYDSVTVKVVLQIPGRPRQTIQDTFVLPPTDETKLRAYYEGKSKPDDRSGGFLANKFYHFIEKLGFPYPPGGKLPEAARHLKNWKNRAIWATVQPGKDWVDDKGTPQKGYNQIKLFSYRASQETIEGKLADGTTVNPMGSNGSSQPSQQVAPATGAARPTSNRTSNPMNQAASQAASQVASVGLNDL